MRDYISEMEALVNALKSVRTSRPTPYSPRLLATKVIKHCQENDPDLLLGWLLVRAEDVMWQTIRDQDRSTRAHARATSTRKAFGRAAQRAENGEQGAMADWLNTPWSIGSGQTKLMRDMTGDDLLSSAEYYSAQARRNEMQAIFLEAVAKQVGAHTVAELYSNDELDMMWRSLST